MRPHFRLNFSPSPKTIFSLSQRHEKTDQRYANHHQSAARPRPVDGGKFFYERQAAIAGQVAGRAERAEQQQQHLLVADGQRFLQQRPLQSGAPGGQQFSGEQRPAVERDELDRAEQLGEQLRTERCELDAALLECRPSRLRPELETGHQQL